ncbi:unnamed protein product [Rhizophagus irregularis]|nr:unnamed protein product [Rhizophagus irregularis]
MATILHSSLSKDLSLILNDADDFNVIIQVGEDNNIKEFRAHSVILRARSSYFKSALSNGWVTKKDGMYMYNKPNIAPTVFGIVLKYIYTGELDLEEHKGNDILQLLVASDELLLEELFEHVQEYLFKKRATWIQKNISLVLNTVFKRMCISKLQECCLKSICANPQPFITSESFLSLDKDILYILLKREDMQIDEIIIWECLIKWGIEQTPSLGSMNNDRTKWKKENYEALKKTLDKFVPLIRFVEISPTDCYDKVRPYKTIIPNHIYDQIEEFCFKGTLQKATILPPRVGKIQFESKIIRKKLIYTIINWINKKDVKNVLNKKDSLYKFELIYQGSKDGIYNHSFKKKCSTEEPILVLIKSQNSRKIFGGYTPIGFNRVLPRSIYTNSCYMSTTDSFIFSFEKNDDNQNIQNMKISRVKSPSYAIYNNYYGNCGFKFGDSCLYMQDSILYVNNVNTRQDSYYEQKLKCTGTYTIDEIEAFRVVSQE